MWKFKKELWWLFCIQGKRSKCIGRDSKQERRGVCVCVCVRENERGRERERKKERECACVWEREGEQGISCYCIIITCREGLLYLLVNLVIKYRLAVSSFSLSLYLSLSRFLSFCLSLLTLTFSLSTILYLTNLYLSIFLLLLTCCMYFWSIQKCFFLLVFASSYSLEKNRSFDTLSQKCQTNMSFLHCKLRQGEEK